MKYYLLPLLLIISCGAKTKPDAMATARKAMQYFKSGNADGVRSLLNPQSLVYKDKEGTDFYVSKASELLNKYGIAPENTWAMRVDTFTPILIYETITIPIFKGYDSTNHLEEAYLKLKFDHTGQYLPKSKMAGFEYRAHRRYP